MMQPQVKEGGRITESPQKLGGNEEGLYLQSLQTMALPSTFILDFLSPKL